MRHETVATVSAIVSAGVCMLAIAALCHAEIQSKGQQKCMTTLSNDAAQVSKVQQKLQSRCMKRKAADKLGVTVDQCIGADEKGKLADAQAKTVRDYGRHCVVAPDFGAGVAATVNTVASTETLALLADALSTPIGPAVSSVAFRCRQLVLKALDKVLAAKMKVFGICQKKALATATSETDLRRCLLDVDLSKKVIKAVAKLNKARAKACQAVDLAVAFGGDCAAKTGAAFDDCLKRSAECRACLLLTTINGLIINCDGFDDGFANSSCALGLATTTTTPTSTTTTTSTTTSTTTTSMPACGAGGECLVFLSAGTYSGQLANAFGCGQGVIGADCICQGESATSLATQGRSFQAWISDTTSGPATRFATHASDAYRDVAATLIASSWTDLTDGTLAGAIVRDQHGNTPSTDRIYTNTTPAGAPANPSGRPSIDSCDNWASSSSRAGGAGALGATDSRWTVAEASGCGPLGPVRLYCFEQ